MSNPVEPNIDSTVHGRLGFPSPLPPHRSLGEETPETSLPDDIRSEILSKISQLMKYHHVDCRPMVFLSREESAQTSSKCPTVLIDVPLPNNDSWYILLRDIHDYLLRNYPQTIAVEIIDMSLFTLPLHLPVEQSHPIIPVWDRLVKDIRTDLSSRHWSSISSVRRGHENSPKPVTIVITTPCPAELEQHEPTIIQRAKEYGLTDIKVAFVEVKNLFW